MKKYIRFDKQKILVVNKKYNVGRFHNPGDLLPEVKQSFETMQKDALKDNIKLFIVSGYRSFRYQKKLYNKNKKNDPLVDTYLAKAGHSEHQTGLAIDICNAESALIEVFKKEFAWLHNNAYKYGFILRYPEGKEPITNYKYEPWHYRYVGVDLATILFNEGQWKTLEEYFFEKQENI